MGPPNQSSPPPQKNGTTDFTILPKRQMAQANFTTPPSGNLREGQLCEEESSCFGVDDLDQPFVLLRDSLVFNHERLVQPDGLYHPSMNTFQETSPPSSPTRKTYNNIDAGMDVPIITTDRQNLNMANANNDDLRKNVSWIEEATVNDSELRQALEEAKQQQQQMSHNNLLRKLSTEIPLSGTEASLNLPFSQGTPEPRQQCTHLQQSETCTDTDQQSATTMTTVYSYKCNRSNRKMEHSGSDDVPPPLVEDGNNVSKTNDDSMENIYSRNNGTTTLCNEFNYEERIQQVPYPYVTPRKQLPWNRSAASTDQKSDLLQGETYHINQGSQVLGNELLDTQPEGETGRRDTTKWNDGNLRVESNVQIDDDLDEDLSSAMGKQQQPVFPNPEDLKWPDATLLRLTLPKKYHTFLAVSSKKDCRAWLWKNGMGRRAREILRGIPVDLPRKLPSQCKLPQGGFGVTPSRTLVSTVPRQLPPDVPEAIKTFTDTVHEDDEVMSSKIIPKVKDPQISEFNSAQDEFQFI